MTPLTFDAFLDRFPFFRDADFALVEAALAEAHASYGGCAGYPQYHGIIGNHAAHILASEPGGHTMRLSDTDAITVYSVNRDALLRQVPRSGSVVP